MTDVATPPMRILDPSGAGKSLVEANFPDATYHRASDEQEPYDAVLCYNDLDNTGDPHERIAALAKEARKLGKGRLYVGVQEGRIGNTSTPGRRRAWRSVDVADLLRRHGDIKEFGVDDDGFISAVLQPSPKREEIAIWTGHAIGPWHPMDIVHRGLGGSETAAWRIAEELSEAGHVVTLYGHFQQEGALKNVILKDWRRFDPTVRRKCVVCFRDASMFDMAINAETTILWLEDVAGAERLTPERAERVDFVCGVSEWHQRNILEVHPYLDPKRVLACRNGVTLSYFEGEQPKREKRVLYTSSPDRGLDIVLKCWPEIKRRVPNATLEHMYGPWYDLVANVVPAIAQHRANIRELSKYDGVTAHPPMGQKKLAGLMRESTVWVAPSYCTPAREIFNETNCVSSQEAQAAGCRVVCGDWGALHEMVKTGVKIPGDPTSKEWQEKFIDAVVDGLGNTESQKEAQTEGPAAMADRGWDGVAEQVEAIMYAAPAMVG